MDKRLFLGRGGKIFGFTKTLLRVDKALDAKHNFNLIQLLIKNRAGTTLSLFYFNHHWALIT